MTLIRSRLRFYLAILGLLILLGSPSIIAKAQSETPIDLSVSVGFDGVCKEEHWFPVRLQFENQGPAFDGSAAVVVPDFPDEWSYARPLTLAEGARKELTILAFARSFDREILIRLVQDGDILFEQIIPINCIQDGIPVIGIWATTPSAFNVLGDVSVTGVRGNPVQLSLADFPVNSQGLEALDIIVLSDVDTGELSGEQFRALETWISNGGRLIVTGGTGWQKTAAGLPELLALQPTGSVTLDSLDPFIFLAGGSTSIEGAAVAATGTLSDGADVILGQGDTILVARKRIGHGESFYFAVDPALAPLRSWPGMSSVYATLLKNGINQPTWSGGFSFWFEAMNGMFNIPGLGLPSALLICGFLLGYVVIVGPINFFILSRLKKREWAWLSIPVLVILFSGIAFLIGLNIRGSRPVIHELSMVQVWTGQTQARVDTLVGVFSPRRDTYRLEVGHGMIGHPIPSGGIGDGGLIFEETVDGVTIPTLRVDIGGIQAIATTGQINAPLFSHNLEITLGQDVAILRGEVMNQSGLRLIDAVFLGPSGLQEDIGTFSNGDSFGIDTAMLASSASQSLSPSTGFQSGGDNTASELFGPEFFSGFDDPEISRRISLFQAAYGNGGTRADGYYVMGWVTDSPIETDLPGKLFQREALTLYIIEVTPRINFGAAELVTVGPRLFSWSLIDSDGTGRSFSPYNASLFNSDFSMRFLPSQLLQFESIESLTLHLDSYGASGGTELDISLWNFENGHWELIESSAWGDYLVPEPERYVGFGGELRLRLTTLPDHTTVQLERADFTLVVKP
jgi:hypothetical protein